jgi:hypothetical protein
VTPGEEIEIEGIRYRVISVCSEVIKLIDLNTHEIKYYGDLLGQERIRTRAG